MEALNSANKLPRIMVIVLDKEVIEDVNLFDYGVQKEITEVVNKLTRQVDINVRRKRLQLSEKRPGAITSDDEPILIYTTMMRRARNFKIGSKMEAVCSVRTKFNDILNDAVAKQDQRILSIRTCNYFHSWLQPLLEVFFSIWDASYFCIQVLDCYLEVTESSKPRSL